MHSSYSDVFLSLWICRVLCDEELHICKKRCAQECGPCTYGVEKTLRCGHINTVPCNLQFNESICKFPCDKRLEKCGHICTLTCHIDYDPEHVMVSVFCTHSIYILMYIIVLSTFVNSVAQSMLRIVH